MMKRVGLGTVAALALLATGTAQAQPTYNWTGFYAGAEAGGGWGSTNMKWGSAYGGALVYNDGPVDISGAMGGLYAGYNYQMQSLVIGVESAFGYAGLGGNDGGRSGDLNKFDGKWDASLRLRAGYAFNSSLLYATAGGAWWDVDGVDARVANTQNYQLWGWTVGAGFEHAFTPHLTARIDYRYSDFGSETKTYSCGGPCYNLAFDPHVHSVMVGLGYKF